MSADVARGAWCVARAASVSVVLLVTGCEWFTTFTHQPRIEPWEAEFTARDSAGRWVMNERVAFRGNPQGSVPITGVAVPAWIVSYRPHPATIDSMSGLVNPRPPSDASLENGRKYYQINCTVCHGAAGAGNGPALRFGVPAPTLLTDITRNRTDGYLFGIMRNGRGLMPNYNRIEEADRWDVVNYVRALQGRIPARVDSTAAGFPGENGRSVPGPSTMAPTRPVPFFHPSQAAARADEAPGDTAAPAAPRAPSPGRTP
ncbi:MAG TPA: cytochrome c [Gemmatimonadaceae bacterium]|nr:cytochrome c [Gemmatimonadaceae bacterium]